MGKIRVCVVGYGNVGKEATACILQTKDLELAGIVRRNPGRPGTERLVECPVVASVQELGEVDVAILSIPSTMVPSAAPQYLDRGINTVDAYDMHGEHSMALRRDLALHGARAKAVAIVGAGWDPGTDSVFRVLFEAMAPRGITYTNFGPGMSMGHTVAVKAIPGVKNALSMTLPVGFGTHKRDVYVDLEEGVDFDEVASLIKKDPYFAHDDTRVVQVTEISTLTAMGHGVLMQRFGGAGSSDNQLFELKTRLTNPAATAQVMVAAARASMRLAPGAYALPEVPPIYLLEGEEEDLLKRLI